MIRSWKFAKFLPEFDYASTVLTPTAVPSRITIPDEQSALAGVRVVRTPYADAVTAWRTRLGLAGQDTTATSRAPGPPRERTNPVPPKGLIAAFRLALREMVTTPDEQVGWLKPGLAAARELLLHEPHDVIYSTSPPETSHLIARRLKAEFGLPWIADLRDLWSGDHFRRRTPLKRWILERLERRTLTHADAIVTVSEQWRADLARHYETPNRPVVCVPHGFDDADYASGVVRDPRVFRIVYTGSLDRDFQDPEPLMRVVGRLLQTNRMAQTRVSLDFHVFGDNQPDLEALALRHGIENAVWRLPSLGYLDSLRTQQHASVLLAIQWRSDAGKGNPPLKVYDYLGARRPILVIGSGDGVLGPLIDGTGAGVVAPTDTDLEAALIGWYDEFIACGDVSWHGHEDRVQAYSRRLQAGKLADLMTSLTRQSA